MKPLLIPKLQLFLLGLEGTTCVWIFKGCRLVPGSLRSPVFEWQLVVATTFHPWRCGSPSVSFLGGVKGGYGLCVDMSLWDMGAAAVMGTPSLPHCLLPLWLAHQYPSLLQPLGVGTWETGIHWCPPLPQPDQTFDL